MIPKKNRMKTRLFDRVFRRGKRTKGRCFDLIVLPHSVPMRACVVVRKKQTRMATDRNRLRRQLYAQLRAAGVFDQAAGHMIFLYKGAGSGHTAAEICADIARLTQPHTP